MAELKSHGSWLWELISKSENELPLAGFITISVVMLAILWYKLSHSSLSKGAPSFPPGPRSLPIVGYLPFLSRDLLKQFSNMANTYGPIFKFSVGSKLHVVVNTMELAKVVLRDQDESFAHRQLTVAASIITYGGQDIMFSNNPYLRKILVQEVLSNKNLEACRPFRREEVRKTIKNVFGKIGTPVDIKEISFMTVSNVVTSMVWENSLDKLDKSSDLGVELQTLTSKIVEIVGEPNLSDFFPSLAWFDLQGIEREMKRQLKKLDQLFARMIEDRILSNSKQSQDGVEHVGKKDFLQALLDIKDKKDARSLSITQIKSLLLDIITGGSDTQTRLIEWAMAEIIENSKVMKRIHEELEEIVGVNNIVEESHLPKLQYLDATIKETLRMHPIGPLLFPRSPNKDCIVGGYTVPKGCTVFLNVWSIQRDPLYWDNPLEFNPERFLSSEGTNKLDFKGNNLKFLPFGSGRRVCPGIPLAEKMLIYILASLLHSFDWSLPKGEVSDLTERFGITLHKAKPLVAIPSQRLPTMSLYV